MPEIYEGLKKEFPSLSDDDAAKATEQIVKVAPQLPAAQDYRQDTSFYDVPDPGNDTAPVMAEAAPVEPRFEPEPQEQAQLSATPSQRQPSAMDIVKNLSNPEALAKAQADYEKYTGRSPGSIAAGIMQWFPRLNRFANKINSDRARGADQAKFQLQQGFEAAKFAQNQENWAREQEGRDLKSAIDMSAEQRAQQQFSAEQPKRENEAAQLRRLNDINSQDTQILQMLGTQMLGNDKRAAGIFSQMNGAQISERFPQLIQSYNALNSRLEAQARLQDADLSRQQAAAKDARDYELRKEDKDKQKKALVTEVEERKNSILYNIEKAQEMIGGKLDPRTGTRSGGKGTYEAIGPHNQNLDRLMSEIATDMAKLQDPNSVARPGEVELILANLVRSGFQNKNETAMQVLDKFKADVEQRAKRAYEVRGLEMPSSGQPSAPPPADTAIIDTPKGRKSVPRADVEKYLKAGAKLVQ